MPRVTIIIPSYNHEKYVAEAIQSVLDQTYQDFEIVITDDGSVDHTVGVIKTFFDPRIRLFCFEKNQGASIAMNHCISQATGEYIAVLNSDDVFLPDKLEKQVKFLDEHEEIAAVFGYAQCMDDDGNDSPDKDLIFEKTFVQSNRTRSEWLNYFIFFGNAFIHPSVLIRKKCYDDVGIYDERLAQMPDFDFWIRLCLKYEIYVIPEKLIKFRVREYELNASGDRPEVRMRTLFEYERILNNYLNIKSKEDFLKIFPEAKEYENEFYITLIPFYISQLLLNSGVKMNYNFAMYTLFNFLKDKETCEFIYAKYKFSIVDFIKLTGENDIFNIEFLREKDAVIAEKDAVIAEKESVIRCIVVEKENAIIGFIHSTSWKITAPVRFFKDVFIKNISHFFCTSLSYGIKYSITELFRRLRKRYTCKKYAKNISCSRKGLVSIVLPVYNQSDFIDRSIKSVLKQSYTNIELIIVNDGSTDNVERILDAYIHNPRVIILTQKNKKLPAALNAGFDMASGEYCTWTSADNIMHKDQLKTMVRLLENNKFYGMIYTDYSLIDINGNPFLNSSFRSMDQDKKDTQNIRLPNIYEKSQSFLLGDNFIGPSFLYRRDIAWFVGEFADDTFGGEDYDYWLRIFCFFDMHHCQKILYKYRIHENTLFAKIKELNLADNISRAINRNFLRRKFIDESIFNFIQYECNYMLDSISDRGENIFIFKLSNVDREFITKTLCTYKSDLVVCVLDLPLAEALEYDIDGIDICITVDFKIFDYFKEKYKYKIFLLSIEKDVEFFKNLTKYRLFEKRNIKNKNKDKDCILYYPDKIHVAIHVSSLDRGGLEQVVYNLVNNFDKNKIECIIFVNSNSYGATGKKLIENNFKVFLMKDGNIEDLIVKYKVDIAHFQNNEFGMDIYKNKKISILYTVHNSFPSDKYNFVRDIVDRYIAVSSRVKDTLIKKNNVSPSSVQVIPNGFDKNIFNNYKNIKREDIGFTDEDFIFVSVGAFYADKFHALILTALYDLSKNYKNFRLILIGDVLDEKYYSFILEMINDLKLVQQVKIFISIDKTELGGLFSVSDCFLLSSLHEGWSNAVMEAMYFELPLILSDTGSSRDIIKNNDIGIVISNPYNDLVNLTELEVINISKKKTWNNLVDLKNAMCEISLHSKEWKEKAKFGKQKVLEMFSIQNMVKNYEYMYTETVYRHR